MIGQEKKQAISDCFQNSQISVSNDILKFSNNGTNIISS